MKQLLRKNNSSIAFQKNLPYFRQNVAKNIDRNIGP
jgi:hypothetical protein